MERLDENTLKQKLYDSFIKVKFKFQEQTIYQQYNLLDDSLYLVIADKLVQGRVRRMKHQMNWKVLPNLETYLKLFKHSSEGKVKYLETFYDFDYIHLGNINLKTKHIKP